ncbi:ubiquitin carboxyl-terminal hydrolase 34-like isoform X2 [Lineus longissimus]|uniref:ubiquitin carboxyl-terminal hydrolase 34-like isoform X2 n=1 Tax=Lineus longissimus TaxID=88925 RepID=UPI00315D4A86
MCDVCADLINLLELHDARFEQGDGLHLSKGEIFTVLLYTQAWPQRQCTCCYRDVKNFERLNNIVQVILNLGIKFIKTWPADYEKELAREKKGGTREEKETKGDEEIKEEKVVADEDKKSQDGAEKISDESDTKETEETTEDGKKKDAAKPDEQSEEKPRQEEEMETEDSEMWNSEEKDKLLQFIAKIFLMNFPPYMAYKHMVHSSLEELSQQEANALNNYCEISDSEIPLYLLRNVCFFCDSTGLLAIANCFDTGNPDNLPFYVAHTLITIIANLRLWMNIPTVMQYIVPLRSQIIRYMCKLSDKDLRMAGSRNMTDLMWAAVKEPLDTAATYDSEVLNLAFKYFTCSTLTIRMAGISQINNQINMYNENCNSETIVDAESTGNKLATWLIEKKLLEHIFGPNLHIEIIKQSQMILNFLAVESRITNEHIDCIWAATQLKHCGKQVHDVLMPLIKNLDIERAQHLLKLISGLEPSMHSEQTLYLASNLIKRVWTSAGGHRASVSAVAQHGHGQYTAIVKENEEIEKGAGIGEPGKHDISPSEKSEEISKGRSKEARKGGKRNPEHPNSPCSDEDVRMGSQEVRLSQTEDSENSSLCANSDLSNISEDSLPSDEMHSGPSRHHCRHRHHGHRIRSHVDNSDESGSESDSDNEGMSESEQMCESSPGQVRVHRCHMGSPGRIAQRFKAANVKIVHASHSGDEGDVEISTEESDGEDDEEEDDEEIPPDHSCRRRHHGHSEMDTSQESLDDDGIVPTMKALPTRAHVTSPSSSQEFVDSSVETEVYDCTNYLQRIQAHRHHRRIQNEFIDDILSPDDGSCNSSRISTKSVKNMADFEGEDVLSDDDELARINAQVRAHAHAHAHFNPHVQPHHLASMASMHYSHLPIPRAVIHHHSQSHDDDSYENMSNAFKYDDVCKKGNTLLWDLVQEDVAAMLPEGLDVEAEKALCSLVCFSTDRRIRMAFIEACIENVANHRSVVVSLRLLPKLFGSFQQYRAGADTYSVLMWAEKELNMMKHFFNELIFFSNSVKKIARPHHALYTFREDVHVRLQFLSCVFSTMGSPDTFRLRLEQVDVLWSCLIENPESTDECLSWFLQQAKSKEHHAMGLETFKHLFMEKMPRLEPENMSVIGLNLFQQLCHLARVANASFDEPMSEDVISGMDQLWQIALRAHNSEVSMSAIQYLNAYYINYGNGSLGKEEEFIQRCMDSLSPDSSLLVIQRDLVLLKNHLESFRKRYAFHLRTWQLKGEGIISHQKLLQDKQSCTIHIVLQPAGMAEKQTTLELFTTDLIAELRSEVTRWWGMLQKQQQQERQQPVIPTPTSQSTGSVLTPILGSLLGDGPVRMITLGQELTVDLDEKSLGEMQFKDRQLVFVSIGAIRPPRKQDGTTPASYLPPPQRDQIPMVLLLQERHFDHLFNLLQELSNLQCTDASDSQMDGPEQGNTEIKARVLSHRVWELLMVLPTSPSMLEGFKSIVSVQESDEKKKESCLRWNRLLDCDNPHKLMYSLQIVESLSRTPSKRRRHFGKGSGAGDTAGSSDSESGADQTEAPEESWSRRFVSQGGLSHMFNIFMSGCLQAKEGDPWNEWNQECLGYLMRLITQFAVCPSDLANASDDPFDQYETPRKKMKKHRSGQEKITIPRLNETMLSMMVVDDVLKILTTILYDVAVPSDKNSMQVAAWGRAEVVHYALQFLVSWAYSDEEVQPAMCTSESFSRWVKRLVLDAPEPSVRREACMGLYRLCHGTTADGSKNGYSFLLPLLSCLLTFLDVAKNMKPLRTAEFDDKEVMKEPYGPCCRDYFWLVCRLVESISREDATKSWEEPGPVNLDVLAHHAAKCVVEHDIIEPRQMTYEDDALIGLINLTTVIMKHVPPFQDSQKGRDFLDELFWSLFALPSPQNRLFPKCKSQTSRSAAYDLIVESVKACLPNYQFLHERIMKQHTKDAHAVYPWDHWPHEDGRSNCGYVGLTNLGATCYMATCMQHLFMIPQARESVLQAKCSSDGPHEGTLVELRKMFAYLLESERKAYNPRSFCKVYTMDKQPLNTGEQKDMTEFFTDLISKLEEMSPELKRLVKSLFGGVISNNVVSLDCPHVSRTLEEFYTVRCQVADMKNLYESLDEVTVKDTLEGDNMYTCSKCGKKVRAEKRACFRKLPKILCFNTMRYTFNMVTMMKEKVNTHFSFPLRLSVADYMEQNLLGPDKLADEEDVNKIDDDNNDDEDGNSFEYELIGVTVHTGTADGGHYYSFIRDRLNKAESGHDRWFLFNDAEVKPFDPCQIASECFGGEMTSKTYDSVTDKFMDFSFEKTNSAYMLFYERIPKRPGEAPMEMISALEEPKKFNFDLSGELAEWIWEDNTRFLQDKNILEHTYFGFMWQMCGYIPTTLPRDDEHQVPLLAAKLSASFVLETLIHAKEKPTMLQWIELLTKQFNSCHAACEWFLDHMAEDDWWCQQILIKCPNQVVRQMFQRLLIHVITQLKPTHVELYLHPLTERDDEDIDPSEIGNKSCVTRFIKKMLAIVQQGAKPSSKHLAEYFAFFLDFAKMGDDECIFLIQLSTISTFINFYMGYKCQDNYVEIISDEEDEEEDVIALTDEKFKPISLEKMIALISLLVEQSRGEDRDLQLSEKDFNAIVGGKGFPFFFSQIRDSINLRQTCNLIFSMCRWNERLAVAIVQMIFTSITKLNQEQCQPFFKVLSMLVEIIGGPPGLPPFTRYILQKFWELAEYCPQQCLEWLATQVTRNKIAHQWVLSSIDSWVEPYLLANNNHRVRNAAAHLLVSLVPSNSFRQAFRSGRSLLSPHKEITMNQESIAILHEVYRELLRLLSRARHFVDASAHGTTKLVSYFTLMTFCLVSRTEKLMFSQYFLDLWQLFQPKLTEPPIAIHHNKQALLIYWHQACIDCPDNIKLIVSNAHVTKNIAFNYILADHDDQEVVLFNRCMLPAYYGILRMCCQHSRPFTRQLAHHQNIQWAFKNITPYPAQYTVAVEELFKMMRFMATKYTDSTEEDIKSVNQFKRTTLQLYLQNLEARSNWQTMINAFKILVETNDDRLMLLYNNGLQMMTEAFSTLHMMFHEATACHVTGDIVELLQIVTPVLKAARVYSEKKVTEVKACLHNWKERVEFMRKLLQLLNSYVPNEARQCAIYVIKEILLIYQNEALQAIVPIILHSHSQFQDSSVPVTLGPFFPRRGQKSMPSKSNIRPPRPLYQMVLQTSMLESTRGVDKVYDEALANFYFPYYHFIDLVCRVAVNTQTITENIINLSAMIAYEGVPLNSPYFAKLWYEIYHTEHIDKNCISSLCKNTSFIDYVDAVLMDERASLNNHIIYQFFCTYFPKVHQQVLNDQGRNLLVNIITAVAAERASIEAIRCEADLMKISERINGDMRALLLIFSVQPPKSLDLVLKDSLEFILKTCKKYQEHKLKEKQDAEKLKAQEAETEEVPTKRRKLSEEQEKEEAKPEVEEIDLTADDVNPGSSKDDEEETREPSASAVAAEADDDENDEEEEDRETRNRLMGRSGWTDSEKKRSEGRIGKEKPGIVDNVVKSIETLFNIIEKNKAS